MIPFPSTPEDQAAAARVIARHKRASDLALGKVALTARDKAKQVQADDHRRGWRVLVPVPDDCTGWTRHTLHILAVDPGAKGGWACWYLRGSDGWLFGGCGDGLPDDIHDMAEYALIVIEDQTGFRYTGKRGTNVSEHTAGRNWGHAAGTLEAVCRHRGWPLIAVQARTWQTIIAHPKINAGQWIRKSPGSAKPAKIRAEEWLARYLGQWGSAGWEGAWYGDSAFYSPAGRYLDGRGDAACIGWWATQNLPAILSECSQAATPDGARRQT